MEYAILQHNEKAHLHVLENKQLTPLGPVPGLPDAGYSIATDNASFAFIDQTFKRIGFYKIVPEAPYYEALISPFALPKNCRANCLLINHQTLYVAGSGKDECLWKIEAGQKDWLSLPLSDQLAEKSNKSIDILFVDQDQLSAIDSLGRPKSIVTYDLTASDSKPRLQTFKLQSYYMKHESVILGARNKNFIALFSIGFVHGEAFYFLSLLNQDSLKKIWTWSTSVSQNNKGFDHYILNGSLKAILSDEFLSHSQYGDADDTELNYPFLIANQSEDESEFYSFYRDKRPKHTPDELVDMFNGVMDEFPSFFDQLGMEMTEILDAEKLFDQYEPWRKRHCVYEYDVLAEKCYDIKEEKKAVIRKAINKLRCKKYITRLSNDPEYLPRAQLTNIDFLGKYLLFTTESKLFKFDTSCFDQVIANDRSGQKIAFEPVFLKKVRSIEGLIKSHHNQDEITIFGYDKINQPIHEVVRTIDLAD